jgi:tetraacyldisaccharide 4'-kinase
VAFAGIAKPERFFDALEGAGLELAARVRFRDHHRYRERDHRGLGPGLLVTTEKDAVRLPRGDFCFLRVSANILNFEALSRLMAAKIETAASEPD